VVVGWESRLRSLHAAAYAALSRMLLNEVAKWIQSGPEGTSSLSVRSGTCTEQRRDFVAEAHRDGAIGLTVAGAHGPADGCT
jgi:hypothetical protein